MKYDAFISYRHLEKDMFVAKGIHKALETTKIPLRIRKEIGKKGIQRVFRDQEELPIGASLSENIEAALAESEFLVVICSPETKESAWVMKEIDTFISMHGKQNILAVLAEGEPEESFPQQLMTDDYGNPREPLAADVRGSSKSEIKKKIKSESLRLAASILYCDYDTLRQRHRERVMRRYTGIAAAVAALGVAFGAYNAYNLARINENYQQKLINESKVLASTSRQVLDTGNRKAAALIALEALPGEENDRPFVANAMYALSEALGTYSTGEDIKKDKLLTHDVLVDDFVISKDRTRIFSYDDSEALYYWDITTGDLLFKVNPAYFGGDADRIKSVGINETCASVISQHFFTGYDEEGKRIYDVRFSDYVSSACYSKSANYVAANFRDYVVVYDAGTGKEAYRFEDETVRYGSRLIFRDDDKLLAVETALKDETGWDTVETETSTLTVFDLEKGGKVDLAIDRDYILDMFFTPDDFLAVSSTEEDNLLQNGEFTDSVQKINYKTGETIWRTELNRSEDVLSGGYTLIKGRIIDSPAGKKGELFVSVNRKLYNLNLYSGELNCAISFENDIISYYITLANEIVRVGLSSGEIDMIDGDTGYNYSDYTQEVGDRISSYYSAYGDVIATKRLSPDIIIMNYLEDPTKETLLENDTEIYNIVKSPDGSTYFYLTKEAVGADDMSVYVRDSATDKELARFTLSQVSSSDISYKDNNTIIAFSYKAGFYFCDIESGDMELMEWGGDYSVDWLVSDDKKVALAVDSREYKRYDLDSRKLIDEGMFTEDYTQGYFYDGRFSSNGNCVCYWDNDGLLYRFDFEKKELEQLFENCTIINAEFSKDFSKVLMQCTDGVARVADLSTKEIQDEVSFYGSGTSHMGFSDDGHKINLKGADYYFKIYDLVSDEYVFVSDEQWNWARYTREIPEKNILIFCNYAAMVMIDLDTYGILGTAEYGTMYLEETGYIYSSKSKEIYKFKVKSLEDLISEAKEKYGDAKLTSEERLKYKLY